MANKRRKKPDLIDSRTLWLCLAWAVGAGLWLLVAAALASYDPADWPGHTVAPYNTQPHNRVGRVGAYTAHKLYLMVGPGVWIAIAGGLAVLVATAMRRAVTQPVLRVTGVVVMSLTTSAIIGLGLPQVWTGSGGRPEGAGGLIALYVNSELSTRFGFLGTMIILGVAFWVGAILAADQAVLALPRLIGWVLRHISRVRVPRPVLVGSLPRLAGSLFGMAGSTAGALAGWARHRGRVADDAELDEDEEYEEEYDSYEDEELDEDEPEIEAELDEEEYEEEDEEDDTPGADAPGAYVAARKSFDPDALRAKIKQLPINFTRQLKNTTGDVLGAAGEVDLSGYQFPGLDLLEKPETSFTEEMERIVRDQAVQLESALQQYRIEGEVVGIDPGPVITLYEIRLAPGTKVSQLSPISSDLARALKAQNIRIVPNMAGKDTVGIEVPNLKKERVRLLELMTVNAEATRKMKLPMYLGKDASGEPQIADLATMPHMLIAGTTGSGKSVCINSIIMSFLYARRPDELKLVLVDPKMVELSMFKNIPHLMCPVVTEMSKAAAILEWANTKMDERYELLAEAGVRDIAGYNALGWEELRDRFEPSTEAEEARIPKRLPYLVFIIDELADLMITNKEVEGFIVRIAQKARAVGIHLILATQRPQANVVTGLIKSNMPCRVSFKVSSGMDSRIVLDQKGAELLLGQGDMLYLSPRTSKLTRAQGTLVDDIEIRRVVKFLKTIAQQNFEPQLMQLKAPGAGTEDDDVERDPLFDDAVRVVLESQRGSVSLLQRRLTVGYSRASRLIEQIAQAGIIGEYKGSQAREVNMSLEEWDALKAQAEADADAADQYTRTIVEPDEVDEEDEIDETDELDEVDEEDEGDEEEEYEEEECEYEEGEEEEEEETV